jgi:ribonuclease D
VLTHLEAGQHVVDCGDTRLMALNLLLDPGTVGVACTASVDQADQFTDWVPVRNNQELIQVSGFNNNATVLVRPGSDQAIEWLEIGDHTTAHHLHSVEQRVTMMQNYMDRNPDTVFDTEWARSYINWQHYAS